VEQLVARTVGIDARDVRIVRGFTARDKLIEIDGVDVATVERALTAATGPAT
jgi:uncharacterized protein YggU (UPF0235/DUF167 family)